MLEILALLLPVAAASGWYAARKHYIQKHPIDQPKSHRQAVHQGLNYLLSEKSDEALEALSNLLITDCETIETHIALGNLFRTRGEVKKAIDVHQNLIKQTALSESQRASVLFEVGMDYMSAGLFDRAENIFKDLTQRNSHHQSALEQLLQLYQQEKNWHGAIECTAALKRINRVPRGETTAQFHCELAWEAMQAERPREAVDYVKQALKEDPKCVRATLLQAQIELRDSRFQAAFHTLKRVESQDPAYLTEIMQPLLECNRHLEDIDALIAYLEYLHRHYQVNNVSLYLSNLINHKRGINAAIQFMLELVRDNPNLMALSNLLNLLITRAEGEDRFILIRLNESLSQMLAGRLDYQCSQCGFACSEMHWRCPSCLYWQSVKPVR